MHLHTLYRVASKIFVENTIGSYTTLRLEMRFVRGRSVTIILQIRVIRKKNNNMLINYVVLAMV